MNCGECDIDFACAKEGVPCIRLAPPAAPAPAAPVPDGWVMAPREPTEEMIQAAAGAWGESESGLHNAFAAALRGGIAASPAAPAAPVPDALAEAVAKAIYWEWRRDAGYVPWVDGGNSLKQDDARKIARAVVSSAAPEWWGASK